MEQDGFDESIVQKPLYEISFRQIRCSTQRTYSVTSVSWADSRISRAINIKRTKAIQRTLTSYTTPYFTVKIFSTRKKTNTNKNTYTNNCEWSKIDIIIFDDRKQTSHTLYNINDNDDRLFHYLMNLRLSSWPQSIVKRFWWHLSFNLSSQHVLGTPHIHI